MKWLIKVVNVETNTERLVECSNEPKILNNGGVSYYDNKGAKHIFVPSSVESLEIYENK